ncbi:hypothetical protein KNP414_01118 [Paenibacillus mucilaginosus KNP414]|uniref:Uncharacterized protein n=1 Tax=Paenibacillus mucilaginosus (strain KNP414) TaxID=1036673 RepID=F8FCW4_PAEMK|nr:hypothetical protein KNP414_01118 [Paenibacillus mucilaginosus KNP414]
MLYKVFALLHHHQWKIEEEFFLTHTLTFLLYVFVTLPMAILVFLSAYPIPYKKQIIHFLKWTIILSSVEWMGWKFNRISYFYGWNWYWSLFFDINMLVVLRLHFRKYIWAIPVSVVCTLFYLLAFGYF